MEPCGASRSDLERFGSISSNLEALGDHYVAFKTKSKDSHVERSRWQKAAALGYCFNSYAMAV